MQGMSLLGLYEVALGIDEDIQLKTMRVSNVLKYYGRLVHYVQASYETCILPHW